MVSCMNSQFCRDISLRHVLLDYLSLKDKTRCRQTSKKWFLTTDCLNWRRYVSDNVYINHCTICSGMHLKKNCDYCPLCECWTSVEHLVRCQGCNHIYCCKCIGVFCDRCE